MASVKKITMREYNGTDYNTLYPKTIASQVDGIYNPQVIVTAPAGSTITCTKGTTVLTAQEVSGTWTFNVPEYGEWTVSNGIVSNVVTIDAVKQFHVYLADSVLENNSWDTISTIVENGQASSIWSVGDIKNIIIDGVSYPARIIGFNHDEKTAGGKAGITFQLVDCLNTTYKMNSSNTNSGGWTNCAMRSSTMVTLLSKLPSALQNVIKSVNKLTSAGNQSTTINTTSDKLFLLSEVEIFGSATYSFAGEGSQYDWYKAGNTKVKNVNGLASFWWERSPRNAGNNVFCDVSSTGNSTDGLASDSNGVSFAFCV